MVMWATAKHFPHNRSGIENPEDYMWVELDGVYYPFDEGEATGLDIEED